MTDEVAGLLALLDSDHVGPMNIGDPNETTIAELAELVLEVTGATVDLAFEPLPADDPSSGDRTSRSARRSSAGIRPSPSAKVSPSPTTGTGGTVARAEHARRFRRLSVIVPVYDERNTVVEERCAECGRWSYPVDLEVLVVNDRTPTAPATSSGSCTTARCG